MTDSINSIPSPPGELLEPLGPAFAPAPDLAEWVYAAFIADGAELENPEHEHLRSADICFLWAGTGYEKKRKRILGEARLGEVTGSNAWTTGRTEQQLREWFGAVPDFLITLDARWFGREASNLARCAVIEHELKHCAQQVDRYGMPRFSRETGLPLWEIAGHDVEEFTSVASRYGAWSPALQEMRSALQSGPEIGLAEIDGVCGSCLRRAA